MSDLSPGETDDLTLIAVGSLRAAHKLEARIAALEAERDTLAADNTAYTELIYKIASNLFVEGVEDETHNGPIWGIYTDCRWALEREHYGERIKDVALAAEALVVIGISDDAEWTEQYLNLAEAVAAWHGRNVNA